MVRAVPWSSFPSYKKKSKVQANDENASKNTYKSLFKVTTLEKMSSGLRGNEPDTRQKNAVKTQKNAVYRQKISHKLASHD